MRETMVIMILHLVGISASTEAWIITSLPTLLLGTQGHTSTAPGTTFYAAAFQSTIAKRVSCRRNTQPIMYSNSTGMINPPPIEKKLGYCKLEELCHGRLTEVKITKDVIKKLRQIIQEEEWLTKKVKPGWRTGTKITFRGRGTEFEGTQPADITLLISGKKHRSFVY